MTNGVSLFLNQLSLSIVTQWPYSLSGIIMTGENMYKMCP